MIPDWRRASGEPILSAVLKARPEDFRVTEVLGFEPDGDGEHDLLWVEKTGTNTQWLARQLARHAGIPARDVGYSGLKDRNAVTGQWFSVRRPSGEGTDWCGFEADGVIIGRTERHSRKLRTGSHAANRFDILLRSETLPETGVLAERIDWLVAHGIPNYFGEQRFGRDGGNIALAESLFAGRRLDRAKRGIALSAARSYLFNHILDSRMARGDWNRLLPGETVNLDGSGSVFDAEVIDADLAARCEALDVHPTATLWGEGAPRSTGAVAALEEGVVADHKNLALGLGRARVDASSRPLRMRATGLEATLETGGVRLQFELGAGCYATSVVREIATT